MEKSKFKDAVLAITYRCNSRCSMCNIWRKVINYEEIKPEVFNNLPKNLRNINITGGEPFLRPDLDKIMEIIIKRCSKAKMVISSNGFATDLIISQIKRILKIIPHIGIAISLDGIGEKHDQIRGITEGYNKALNTITELKKIGLKNLKIAFTLGNYNAEELVKVYQLAERQGLEFSLAAIHSSSNYFSIENKLIYDENIERVLNWLIKKELKSFNLKNILRAYFAYGLKEFLKNQRRILPDYSGELNIFIDPIGNIYACDVASEEIGNLKSGFSNIKLIKKDFNSWMICTARPAIKKHWLKVGFWILKNKFI